MDFPIIDGIPSFSPSSTPSLGQIFSAASYRALSQNEDCGHYFYLVRRDIIVKLLRHIYSTFEGLTILDIGCGTGYVLAELMTHGAVVTALDAERAALALCNERGIEQVCHADARCLPFEDGTFDIVLMLDLLEHVDDDAEVLAQAFRVLKREGRAIVTVPAFQFLWSSVDDWQYHKRRYSKKQLYDRLKLAGFDVERILYLFSTLLPAVFLFRKARGLLRRKGHGPTDRPIEYTMPPRPLNRLMLSMIRIEALLLPRMNSPAGITLMGIAKKP